MFESMSWFYYGDNFDNVCCVLFNGMVKVVDAKVWFVGCDVYIGVGGWIELVLLW